jgi:hypothetical protein
MLCHGGSATNATDRTGSRYHAPQSAASGIERRWEK